MADRHDAHGYWLAEADPVERRPPLRSEVSADVLVVGGGYTGLWTAWHLKRLRPDARVVLCESAVCGEGPSGRNGGFVNGLWFSLPSLRERFGDEAAIEIAHAAQRSVADIGAFCADQDVDAWFHQAGYLQVSTAPAWDGAAEPAARACAELGVPEACQLIGRRRGAAPLRLADLPRRRLLPGRRDRAAGAARARTGKACERGRGGRLRAHARPVRRAQWR